MLMNFGSGCRFKVSVPVVWSPTKAWYRSFCHLEPSLTYTNITVQPKPCWAVTVCRILENNGVYVQWKTNGLMKRGIVKLVLKSTVSIHQVWNVQHDLQKALVRHLAL